jgi:hypothetical protein
MSRYVPPALTDRLSPEISVRVVAEMIWIPPTARVLTVSSCETALDNALAACALTADSSVEVTDPAPPPPLFALTRLTSERYAEFKRLICEDAALIALERTLRRSEIALAACADTADSSFEVTLTPAGVVESADTRTSSAEKLCERMDTF